MTANDPGPSSWSDGSLAGIGGIEVPASDVARAAAEICRLTSEPYLANHAARSYFWAAHFAAADGVDYDPELLWVAALMHDLGLTDEAPRSECFEQVGAGLAAAFLTDHGWPAERIAEVSDAIAMHMALELPADASVTALLLDAGLSLDVSGRRFDEVPAELREAVLARYPRLEFKRRFARRLSEVAEERPNCTAALLMGKLGMRERILDAPWSE